MSDRWRPVPDWPGYWAERGGDIRSPNGVVLKQSLDRKGYPRVSVYRAGKGSTKRVHVLVAAAWLPRPPKGKTQVRHLDGNRLNCAAWNLKHGDQADQERDKGHAGTSRVKRGMSGDGSEGRGKEGNRTEAYRARATRTSRT